MRRPASIASLILTILALLSLSAAPAGARSASVFAPATTTSGVTAFTAQSAGASAPAWSHLPMALRAGSILRAVLDPVSAMGCRISIAGPTSGHRLDFDVSGHGGDLAKLVIRTRKTARPGRWLLGAQCTQADGGVLSDYAGVRIKARGRAGRGALTSRRAITVVRRSPFSGGSHAGRIRGKGGAGQNPFDPNECTSWAYAKRQDVYDRAVGAGVKRNGLHANPKFAYDYQWNGKYWAENAAKAGIPTGTVPVVGALFVSTSGDYGHVAYVEQVFPDGSFKISERNASGKSNSSAVTTRTFVPGRPGVVFVYGGPAGNGPAPPQPPGPQPSDYAGHIVQWDGDHKGQLTSWLVGPDLKRRWIPTSDVFYCLKDQGHPGPDVLPGAMLDQLADLTGVQATCTRGNGGGEAPPTTTPPPPPTRVNAYDNYGNDGVQGHPMCRGNPGVAASMPGGSASETFTVPVGVASIDTAKVAIDPDAAVTAHATLFVNGAAKASADATAAGDTVFGFGSVPVALGYTVTLSINFTASGGKIITVYTIGSPGGTFSASNSCSAGAPSVSPTAAGLKATMSGWSG